MNLGDVSVKKFGNNTDYLVKFENKDNKKNKILPKEKTEKPKKEIGGQEGPEPTRYGDWEKKGITSDF